MTASALGHLASLQKGAVRPETFLPQQFGLGSRPMMETIKASYGPFYLISLQAGINLECLLESLNDAIFHHGESPPSVDGEMLLFPFTSLQPTTTTCERRRD